MGEVRYEAIEPSEDCDHEWMPPRTVLTPTVFGYYQRRFQRCCYCAGVRDVELEPATWESS